MNIIKPTLIILLFIFSPTIWAKGCEGDKATADKIGLCMQQDLQSQKRTLNKLYDKIYAATDAKAEFEAAQKAWLTYRNKQCNDFVDKDSEYSPASGALSSACEITLISDRIEYLKSLR